jgi:hypothetical protein
MPWMFLLLGLALVADSGAYLLTGEELFKYGDSPEALRSDLMLNMWHLDAMSAPALPLQVSL